MNKQERIAKLQDELFFNKPTSVQETERQKRSQELGDKLWPELKDGGAHLPVTEYIKFVELAENLPSPAVIRQVIDILQKQVGPTGTIDEERATSPERNGKLRIGVVVESLLRHKRNKRVKEETLRTYTKHFHHIADRFPWLPTEIDPLLNYLDGLTGETGRHKRNQFDLLNMLYRHAVRFFGFPKNPLEGVDRPEVTEMPILTLSLEEVKVLDTTPQTLTEKVAWELLLGHGWRQIEARRCTAGDVRKAHDGQIWCWGKEKNEWAPYLAETLTLLLALTPDTLSDKEPVLRSTRIRQGSTQPLGEDGMAQLIGRLLARAGMDYLGHDLRRTFATLVRQASRDEFLAMRLIRDIIPGQSKRYINFPMSELVEALQRYSPLRITRQNETALDDARAAILSGGDGGELNSPSKRSYPGHTTSLISSFILSG